MKVEYIAHLILDYCILFLNTSPVGTKYHPEKDVYRLDSKLLIRIIRYDGNMRAEVTQKESIFGNKVLKELVKIGLITSNFDGKTYECIEDYSFNKFNVIVRKVKKIKLPIGRPAKYIEVIPDVRPVEVEH